MMRILLISRRIPYPPNAGYPLRVYNLLYRIARDHEIWLATFVSADHNPTEISHLQEFCVDIKTAVFHNKKAISDPIGALRNLIKGVPPDIRIYKTHNLSEKIKSLITQVDFDIIQIEDSHMSTYLEVLPKEIHSRAILTFHDVNFIKYERLIPVEPKYIRKARAWLHSCMMRQWEPFYAGKFGRCIAMSDADRDLLQSANPGLKIEVIPNGVDTGLYQPLPPSNNSPALIFVGNMGYRPNIDAMAYFCQDIYPKIKQEIVDLEMWIVGINPSPEVRQLEGRDVHVTGGVEDVRPLYSRSAVCVVPLRAGGGTRLKILEAMALGRPVVSTSIGCEGIEVVDGEHLFIADDPDQFAEKTIALLKDKGLRQHITAQARELVVNRYDWEVITRQLLQVYSEIAREKSL